MENAERQTNRLICRRPTSADEPAYRDLLLAPEVGRWLRPPPLAPYDPAAVRDRLDRDIGHWAEHGFGPWVLSDRVSGVFVGRGGLAWTTVAGERAVELAWSLVPSRWGEGLAPEAARAAIETAPDLEVAEVVAFTLVDNRASLRVMEKIGLTFDRYIEHAGLPHALYRTATGSARRPS